MKSKKAVVGLLSAFLVVGGSASAFAASEGTGNAIDQISATIKTFAGGTSETNSAGKVQLSKKVINEKGKDTDENKDKDKENLAISIKTFEPGTSIGKVDGKEMNKEILEDNLSAEMKELKDGAESNTAGKQLFSKKIVSE